MEENTLLLEKINKELAQEKNLFPDYLAEKIFKYINESKEPSQNLVDRFRLKLREWENSSVLLSRIRYAEKLMHYASTLEYEELLKLYSMFDAIYSLRMLGEIAPKEVIEDYELLQLKFLGTFNTKKLNQVIGDKIEPWKSGWNWYKRSANS